MMKLTTNEKRILKELLADGSVTNVEVGKKLNLTPAAVGKIRRKLENLNLIQGYSVDLDFGKIGITTLAVVLLKFTNNTWETPSNLRVFERFVEQPNIISIYRIPEGETTHILIFGFRNLNEHDRYFHVLQSQYSNIVDIKKIFTFSKNSIVKNSPHSLLTKLISEWGSERMPEPPPILKDRVNKEVTKA